VTAAIVLEDVEAELGNRTVLRALTLRVARGEVLAVLGPSGSGKTTLLRVLTGFVVPRRGTVELGGELASTAGRVLVPPESRNIAMVFQDLALWPHLTVHANLSFGLEARRVGRAQREARIAEVLGRVGLAEKAGRYPGELSGGERQRVAIARALVLEPIAVLLDEPLANLDVVLKEELLATFHTLLGERHMTAVYVTHDPIEAVALGDRIAVLEGGQLVQQGTPGQLRAEPGSEFVSRLFGR
jgi:iron(III) transport system ATP-binding protein